jgi:hypothetical protein
MNQEIAQPHRDRDDTLVESADVIYSAKNSRGR